MNRKVLKVIDGETVFPPPIWMMRQAGRYLPEYRETRKKAGSFLDLCYSPDLAVEVTLQPIRRFGFDAAILFSDILVVPHTLGRDLRFEEGKGPLMTPIDADEIFWLETEGVAKRLEPVYETVRLVREQLPDETTLLGFCGAPWTVATYMIAGHGTPDQAPARLFAYRFPEAFEKLLNDLADVSAEYLIEQLGAGADAVQIFDSWSGVLDEDCFERFCIRPVARIVQKVRAVYPQARIIGFPKGAGCSMPGIARKPAWICWASTGRFPCPLLPFFRKRAPFRAISIPCAWLLAEMRLMKVLMPFWSVWGRGRLSSISAMVLHRRRQLKMFSV